MGEEKVLYSVKMRSSLGGAHGVGGQHISGAERIVTKNSVEQEMISMLHRAWEHDRGAADFIQFKVEAVRHEGITCCPLLPLYQIDTATKEEGRAAAKQELLRSGVSETAMGKGFAILESLTDSMRGAAVVDAETGERLDGEHPREALILASKVAAAPGTVAELCWSDDPFYVTGYVGSPKFGYGRITVMKEKGDPIGGRVFFVKHGTDMDRYVEYMQHQTVLVRIK